MSRSAVLASPPPVAGAPPEPAETRGWLAKLGDAPAWVVSAAVHLFVLFVFAGIVRTTFEPPVPEIVSAIDEPQLDQFKFETATTLDEVGNDSDVNVVSPSKAAATETGREPQEQFERRLDEEFVLATAPVRDRMPEPNRLDLTSAFDVTGTTEHTGGVEGAIDLLTNEIAASLRENETTVVWLFDGSLSLRDRRNKIADRFENIYAQLDKLGVLGEKRLLTVAAVYADKWTLLTDEATEEVGPVAEKIRAIPDPDTHLENVVTAVDGVTGRFLAHRTRQRRNMMVVVVTDERGDDFGELESVIGRLKRYGIKVYCVGNAAPLGQVHEYVPWTYEDGFVEMLPVDRGPEAAFPELLALPFWGRGGPPVLSSGFGPYGLTRLTAETGGLYLLAEETAKSFDAAVMRNYAPDYRPVAVVEAQLRKNLAKQAVVRAATLSQQSDRQSAIPMPRLVFPAENDTVLRQAITEAQKPMAVVDHPLQELAMILEQGARDREKLDTPRWRAVYDLAVGRVAALRARAFGYNTVLAEMKVSPRPFENKNSNQWALRPSDEITGGPAVKKLAETAREHLSRVVDEHPGTPWAELAAIELSTPMGWTWVEQNDLVVRFGPQAADPEVARLLLAEEEERQKRMPKPEPPKPRERPKL
ncbi:MAG TPA: VWA domain-containing protein [Planctomycetaceae bacterium]